LSPWRRAKSVRVTRLVCSGAHRSRGAAQAEPSPHSDRDLGPGILYPKTHGRVLGRGPAGTQPAQGTLELLGCFAVADFELGGFGESTYVRIVPVPPSQTCPSHPPCMLRSFTLEQAPAVSNGSKNEPQNGAVGIQVHSAPQACQQVNGHRGLNLTSNGLNVGRGGVTALEKNRVGQLISDQKRDVR
jgi:hypothetical protein